ncbi:tRNA/rRNA methyltransferase [Hasllibacter halocynthiae]|uniref:tRNA/rRNA methyltransferase n=1 Tax=Hasllibacter halocynthiae TaxID=595589 RepID=A0A2T0X8C9_9RHOB|nr:TrmH family RNA methyltransferase [Hasllibacter halocynthiae]PRY95201.1 tRNA/rRNA methyltransferase [Hasllibacter halocynthiae]
MTPLIVLVRPQMGENVGAAARAMRNFGLSRMALVDPRDGWPNPRAVALAAGAGRVLDDARVHGDVAAAVAGADAVYATTARPRDDARPVLTPEAAVREMRALAARGGRPAILFGPERAGLENDDLAPARAIVTVPTAPDFFSLNLAQCVLLMAYEWGRQGGVPERAREGHEGLSAAETAALADHYERRLDEAGFFFPPEKAPHMKRHLRALWPRLQLTKGDGQLLHGILRQLVRHRDGPPPT